MKSADSDEFFIGWQARQPTETRKVVRAAVVVLIVAALVLAVVFSVGQRTPDLAAYEWSNVQTFAGILQRSPYPHLLVPRPAGGGFSAYPMVAPTKFGIAPEWCGDFDGTSVTFDGGLIFRGGSTLIEVVSDAPTASASLSDAVVPSPRIDFGRQVLVGEIVDAKCYTGAMNPGRYKAHRACATVCVAGGIPPMLVVDAPGGGGASFLLVGPNGEMINENVLPLLARPVRITGQLSRSHDLWILSTNPASIETL